MRKLFDIPVYAFNTKVLGKRVDAKIKSIEKNAPSADRETLSSLIERETFPMRNWDYNHIVGYIQIGLTRQDVVALIFMPLPAPTRYYWNSSTKHFVQNLGANNAHLYIGNMKTNKELQNAAAELLDGIIKDHLNGRFHADRTAFDAINAHLDYLSILKEL